MTAAEADVLRLLSEVMDPGLPALSVTDLGMVYSVRVVGGGVAVELLPTFTGCPALSVIREDAQERLANAGYSPARVSFRMDVPWSTGLMAPSAAEKLKTYGVAPPDPRGRLEEAECPRCGARVTRVLSRFGAAPCLAILKCGTCGETVEGFKPMGALPLGAQEPLL